MKSMDKNIKSGKEILDDFFKNIENIEKVDKTVAKSLKELYESSKFTDANVKNELQRIRDTNGNKN